MWWASSQHLADINECTEGMHQCSHTCINTPGSYRCSCHSGYTLTSDGRGCMSKWPTNSLQLWIKLHVSLQMMTSVCWALICVLTTAWTLLAPILVAVIQATIWMLMAFHAMVSVMLQGALYSQHHSCRYWRMCTGYRSVCTHLYQHSWIVHVLLSIWLFPLQWRIWLHK